MKWQWGRSDTSSQVISRDDFIHNCVYSGYCGREIAETYADKHDVLTDDDYIAVFRIGEERYSKTYAGTPYTGEVK